MRRPAGEFGPFRALPPEILAPRQKRRRNIDAAFPTVGESCSTRHGAFFSHATAEMFPSDRDGIRTRPREARSQCPNRKIRESPIDEPENLDNITALW